MPIAHTLTHRDTMQSLAIQYLGDAANWTTIADYNNLDSPYIVANQSELYQFYGRGYITIARANTTDSLTIQKGWQFKTKATIFEGSTARTFEVTEDTVMAAGVSAAYVPLRCTVPGTFGNVMEYMITELGDNMPALNFRAIYNENCFTGGTNLNVLVAGDTIYIPASATTETGIQTTVADYVNGEDLILDTKGNLIIGDDGDIASTAGGENVKLAVAARITTVLGELTMHSDYGSEIHDLIGTPNIANKDKLMEVAVLRCLALEDRIDNIQIDSIITEGTTVSVVVSYTLTSNNTSQSQTVTT